MSQPLIPCPACNRHVFADACACPFCAVKLRTCEATRAPAPSRHLSRAARLAAGAALMSVGACGSTSPAPPYGLPPSQDAAFDAPADSGADGAGGSQGLTDAANDTTMAQDGSPRDTSGDRGVVPLYGAAAPEPSKPVR